eukprot:6018844-Pyramimonas_sp.AAC.1
MARKAAEFTEKGGEKVRDLFAGQRVAFWAPRMGGRWPDCWPRCFAAPTRPAAPPRSGSSRRSRASWASPTLAASRTSGTIPFSGISGRQSCGRRPRAAADSPGPQPIQARQLRPCAVQRPPGGGAQPP